MIENTREELKNVVNSPRQHMVISVTEAHKAPQTGYTSRDKIRNKADHSQEKEYSKMPLTLKGYARI